MDASLTAGRFLTRPSSFPAADLSPSAVKSTTTSAHSTETSSIKGKSSQTYQPKIRLDHLYRSFNRDTDRTPAASANPSTSAPPTNAGTYGSSISAPVQPVAGPSRLGNAGNSGALVPYGRPLRREDAVIINPETGNRQPRPLRREGAMYLDDELPITAYPIPGPSKRVKSQVAKMSSGSGRPPRKNRPLQQQQHGVAGVDTGNRFIPREGTVYFEPDYRAVETSPRCDVSRFDPSCAQSFLFFLFSAATYLFNIHRRRPRTASSLSGSE